MEEANAKVVHPTKRWLRKIFVAGAFGSALAVLPLHSSPPAQQSRLSAQGVLLESIRTPNSESCTDMPATDRRCLIESLRRSNVRIVSDGVGAGIIIDSNQTRTRVLTAWHVPNGARNVVLQNEGREAKATRIYLAPQGIDLAVIEVEGYLGPAVQRFLEDPWQGMDVIAIGSPLGGDDITTFGHISGFVHANGHVALLTDAAINPGNSGGGVFDPQSGALIGIVTSKPMISPLQLADGMGLVIPAAILREFPLDSWQSAEPPAGWRANRCQ